MAARATGFQQQHATARAAEPVGQYAAGRTGADDDVVEAFAGRRCHAFTRAVNSVGSKYCCAFSALEMLAVWTKKSVTCCSHWVTVPSPYLTRHSAVEWYLEALNCSLNSASGTSLYCVFCNCSAAASGLEMICSLAGSQPAI